MPFDLQTRDEAAERSRISVRLLDQQVAAGTGPAVTRVKLRVLVYWDALQQWMERCIAQTASTSNG